MSRLRRHGAEGVSAARSEGVDADEQHVHQQGPGVAVSQEVHGGAEDAETPQEIPGTQKQLLSHSFIIISTKLLLLLSHALRGC